MRIVEVNPFYYPYSGGIEHRIHNISKILARKHQITILTSRLPNTDATEYRDGYEIIRLPSRYINIYNPPHVITKGVNDAIERMKPDIVNFHYRWAKSYNEPAREYEGNKVFTFHNTFGEGVGITKVPSIINDMLWQRSLVKFAHISCVSHFVKNDLIDRGFDDNKLDVIPNGIENHDPGPWEEKDHLLFVGRLVGTKGLPYLIKAMKWIDSKLIVCGCGPELWRLKALVARLGISNKVRFTGWVDDDRKKELMATCKLFIMPSLFESYGIAVAEAMSYGKAVVTTNVGGLPEVVGGGGALVKPRDIESLINNINALLQDDSLRNKLAERALSASHGHSWENSADLTERLYYRSC